jgi:hypothetical protein
VAERLNSHNHDPTESKMRRSISPPLLRRSPRRLDRNTPPVVGHATLSPVGEDIEEGTSPVVNLFGNTEFSGSTAVGAVGAPQGAAPEDGTAFEAPEEAPKDTIEEPVPPAAAAAASPERAKRGPQPMASPEIRTLDNFQARESKFTDGYDTDGDLVNPKGAEEFEEETLISSFPDPGLEENTIVPTEPIFIFLSAAAIDKLTIPMLKHELMIRAVPCSSSLKKTDLKERLLLAIQNQVKVSVFGDMGAKKKKGGKRESSTDMTGFAPGSHWEPLIAETVQVQEPTNSMVYPRAPTVPVDEGATIPEKFNFKETFDRPLFHGRQFTPRLDASGNRVVGEDGRPLMDILVRQKLVARKKFQELHHLSRYSDPVEFADAFLPWNANVHGDRFLSLNQLTAFTNMKANLANAGNTGSVYPEWTPLV